MRAEGTVLFTVLRVNKDGSVDIKDHVIEGKATMGEGRGSFQTKMSPSPDEYFRMAAQGLKVFLRADSGKGTDNDLSGMPGTSSFPLTPVHRGTIWFSPTIHPRTPYNQRSNYVKNVVAGKSGLLVYVHSKGTIDAVDMSVWVKENAKVSGPASTTCEWVFNASRGRLESEVDETTVEMLMKDGKRTDLVRFTYRFEWQLEK